MLRLTSPSYGSYAALANTPVFKGGPHPGKIEHACYIKYTASRPPGSFLSYDISASIKDLRDLSMTLLMPLSAHPLQSYI